MRCVEIGQLFPVQMPFINNNQIQDLYSHIHLILIHLDNFIKNEHCLNEIEAFLPNEVKRGIANIKYHYLLFQLGEIIIRQTEFKYL
jgi:hypothetical protein